MFLILVLPTITLAHQPRITTSRATSIPDPEISKAYYAKLVGVPDLYIINSSKPFNLYVNVLVPDIAGQKKDVSALVVKDGQEIARLNGPSFEWQKFYEPFGADTYWRGPEYKASVDAGVYEIRVSSPTNDSKYSLAVGEIEAFDRKEGMNALTVIPELKKNFFEESPISFIKSPFGWGLILSMYILSFIFGFIYRALMKKFAANSTRGLTQNIGKGDRLVRLGLSIILLLWAITTSWSPWLIFFSGFTFFEAIFSWCGFYAAIGRSTCPL